MVSDATDPLGRAMLDYQRHGELLGECIYRDGGAVRDAGVRDNYFRPREEWSEDGLERLRSVEGPVVDVGCGAGQHAVWFQEHDREVVAVDVSPGAVAAARERGVDDARVLDMFEVGDAFSRDRFRTAWVNGTQVGLAGSMAGVRSLLADLARVTDDDGVAMVDNYCPRELDLGDFGYRPDPREGIAYRAFHVEYDREAGAGPTGRLVGRGLRFFLFGPDRLRDATVGTPWELDAVDRREVHYKAFLRKG